ncbi:restriction endonuclease subunit S [Vibrio sp. 10N.247.311.59]|uniref:restriction endonuclease subunit S n=1 Tax=Vibrio sp. 10N.247.311.59 TaxID=3229989 RepID=UPI00354E03AF
MTEQMNVPKLRFGAEPLTHMGFDSLVKIKIGLTHTPKYVAEGRPFLSSKNISNGYIDFKDIKYMSEDEFQTLPKSAKPDVGDILFTRVGSNLGNPIVLEDEREFGIFVSLGAITVNELCDNYYVKHWMDTQYFWKQVEQKVAGGAKNNLNSSWLKEFKLMLPLLTEQHKIASFLSKVDEKIGLLSEKKDKLTEYKRGVMQQLFNGKWHEQDGKLTFVPPTLRFKADDGSEFPDWEEKKFNDCFEFFTTNSLSRDKLSYTSGEVKNIHYGDIHTKFRTVFLVTQESVPSIAEAVDTKKIKTQSYCQDGDLVFADASEDYADIGKCIEIRDLGDIKLVSGLHTHLARPKEKFALGYQAYLQKSWKMRYQIMRIAQGTKVLGISTKQLAQIDVPIPCYDEQEKIASLMMALDSKIELLNFEINKAKEWKKGLLQQMFV